MERLPGDFAVTNAVSRVGLTIDGTITEINKPGVDEEGYHHLQRVRYASIFIRMID